MKSTTGKGKKKETPESSKPNDIVGAESAEGLKQNAAEETIDWEQKVRDSDYKYLLLYAEFENFRKRTAKERQELIQTAAAPVFRAILPSLDNLERALKNMRNSGAREEDIQGIELIQQQLMAEFNPDEHEAITQVPGDPALKNKIIDVLEKGYTIHGKILRYARVVVGS